MEFEAEELEKDLEDNDYASKIRCPRCSNSEIIKQGLRITKFEIKQRYSCNSCQYRFVLDANRLKIPSNIRRFILNQYMEGNKSTREVSKKILENFGINVSNVSIARTLKNGERYFGKEIKIEKMNSKRKVKGYASCLFGKEITHKPFEYNRKILVLTHQGERE